MSVRPSVSLSHHSTAIAAYSRFAAERRAGRRYRLTAPGAQQQRRCSTVTYECGQCRVNSRADEAEHRLVLYYSVYDGQERSRVDYAGKAIKAYKLAVNFTLYQQTVL